MSGRRETGDGICILSFDTGGPGTYSQLLLVKEYMSRIASDLEVGEEDVYPADYFDLMGGVGFGALVAIMFGHLRMNVDQAIDALLTIASAVFPEGPQIDPDLATNTRNLQESIENMLQARGVLLDTKMYDQQRPVGRCKVALYAASSANLSHARIFRTYSARGSSFNSTIVEALCATMSTPALFLPTKIGPRLRQQSFVGGALGASNPTRELLNEAVTLFGKDSRAAQVISIGAGHPSVITLGGTRELDQLLQSLSTDCEIVAKELSTRLFTVDAYLRLNVDKGMERIFMTDWSSLGEIESHTSAYVENTAVMDALEGSLSRLRSRMGSIALGQLNHTSSIKVMAKEAPAISPYYVVRKIPWASMVHHLVTSQHPRQKIFPITGMGGCGKTQMVSYFLQEYRSLYKHIVYVDASSSSSIQSDLQAWARSLGDGHERDVWEDGLRFLSSSSENDRHIFVLDNVDDPNLNLVPYLPKSKNLTVVITSRNHALGRLSTTQHLELAEMEDDEALSALVQAAKRTSPLPSDEETSARALAKELGSLAVALVQAGSYCSELSSTVRGIFQPYSLTQYLSLFRAHRSELMKKNDNSTLDNYQRGAYTTFDLSYHAVPDTAKHFLHFMSFFHHTGIPLEALAVAAKGKFMDIASDYLPRPKTHVQIRVTLTTLLCTNGEWNEVQVQDIIRALRSFSLISTNSVDDVLFLQLHPLIQSWSRDMVANSKTYEMMAAQTLSSCCKEDEVRFRRSLIPHILDMLPRIESFHLNDQIAAARILYRHGDNINSIPLFERALKALEYGEGDVELMRVQLTRWLALAYASSGRSNEAEELQRDALEQLKIILGWEHRDTVLAASHLASTCRLNGRWDEAETLELKVLEQIREIFGTEHPNSISAAANLATTYNRQGRLEEAEELQLKVLEQQRNIQGAEHPATLLAMSSLAQTYTAQGRWDEAEKLQGEVVNQKKRILGIEHPTTIQSVGGLAFIYHSQGRLSEAEKLQLEVLEQARRILGTESLDTIRAMTYLAATYSSQGRLEEAESLHLGVLEKLKVLLGRDHPRTVFAYINLAALYSIHGKWDDTVRVLELATPHSVEVLGREHRYAQTCLQDLAEAYRKVGRVEEADATSAQLISNST